MSNYILNIVSVKSDKNKDWKKLQDQYLLYLQKWAKVNVIELEAGKIYRSNDKKQILQNEEKLWGKYLEKDNSKLIALVVDSKEFTTEKFSRFLEENQQEHLSFLIGGPYGLPEKIINKVHHKISLSKLTFNHQLAKLVLLEQLYRGLDIQNSNKYHK